MTGGGPRPSVSVVVPAYNAAATVAAAVRSALGQEHVDVEVVVVDDGSTDETAAVAGAIGDPRVRVVSQPNRGLSAARNAGIAQASGELIAFLDSDDLWLPGYLHAASEALARTDHAGLAYTDAWAFDPVSGRVRRRSAMQRRRPPAPPPDDPEEFLAILLERNFIWVSTVVPADVLAHVGGFDEANTAAGDYELWLRIVAHGYRAAWVPGRQGLYRVHAGQMSKDELGMLRSVEAAYGALSLERLPTDALRAQLRRRRVAAARDVRRAQGGVHRELMRGRSLLGRARRAMGLGEPWLATPPAEVSQAFGDLRAVR